MAIISVVLGYVFDKLFLLQLTSTLATYFAICSVRFLIVQSRRRKIFKYYGIPGPEPSLLDGNLSVYMANRTPFKVEEEMHKKYGKVYGYYMGDEPNMIITDLEILRKIFFVETDSFKLRTKVLIDSPLSESILFAKYDRWKLLRKTLSGPFSKYTVRGDSATQFIETSIKLTIDYINQKILEAKSNNSRALIDIHNLMKSASLHLISNMAVKLTDVKIEENDKTAKSLSDYLSMFDRGLILQAMKYPPIKRVIEILDSHFQRSKTLSEVYDRLNKHIDKVLARLTSQKANTNLDAQTNAMDTLIKLHHDNKLTRKEIMGNAEALLIAGYDTTSTTLAYIFWSLAKYQDIQDRLRTELMAHGIESKYLQQVIYETLRVYPTVLTFTSRYATSSIIIDGWTIPQGTKVVYSSWLINRDPNIWQDPERYDPERFREGVNINPCAFAPFGLGGRKCIGYQLAMLEIKMIICDILIRYKIKLKSPENLELRSFAFTLSKPKESIIIEVDTL